MGFRRTRKLPQFADLKVILAQSKSTDESLYQVVQEIIDRLSLFQFEPSSVSTDVGTGGGGGELGATKFATYHTKEDETPVLPNSVQLLAGSGIAFNDTVANKRTISSTGGSGGPHAPTHSQGGSDPVDVKNLAGYPGNTTTFLRGDKTFAAPPGGGGMNLDYLGDFAAGPTYNDGDIVIGSDGVAYMCVVDGTTTPPEPWPGTGIISSQGPPGPPGATGPIGSIVMWPAATPPTDWLLCQGQAISRATYATLFALIGTGYGVGDGSTTFNLPNMQQRFPLGKAASGTGSVLGGVGGAIDHAHNVSSHAHGVGTLAGASHTHGVTALSVAAHSHDQGSLAVASHTHGPGNLRTEQHAHGFSSSVSGTTGSSGTHNHGVNITTSGPTTQITVQNGTGGNLVCSRTDHTHGVTGNTDQGGNHSHSFSGSFSGTTDNDGGLFVNSGATAAASPGLTGVTGAAGAGVSGAVDAAGVGITGNTAANTAVTDGTNPPFISLNFIIRAI